MVDVLNGVYEFLRTRHHGVRIYGGYVEVTKTQHALQLTISEGVCVISVFKIGNRGKPGFGLLVTDKRFDLSDPSSLQAIYEYVSSRNWR